MHGVLFHMHRLALRRDHVNAVRACERVSVAPFHSGARAIAHTHARAHLGAHTQIRSSIN